jgi:hypothetical protein
LSSSARPAGGGYRPEQQSIPARVFTTAGWVEGRIRAPKRHVWLDHLNTCGPWVKMTGVTLPEHEDEVSFFALSRTAAVLVEPRTFDPNLTLPRPVGATRAHRVDALLDVGVVSGTLELPNHVRVSDHLFGEATLELDLPLAFVNGQRVVGVSELDLP